MRLPFCPSRFFILCILVALLPIASYAIPHQVKSKAKSTRTSTPSGPAYKGAIVVDDATGKVIFEDHADIVNPPASMTKLMTFAVLYDKLQAGKIALSTPVKVTAVDSTMGGTQVYLREGEVFPLEEMIYAMMIQSANDAAYALARTSAGSTATFVKEMNAKAAELGMRHTIFRSPHGLPPESRRISQGDLTTPRDFVILCRYLLDNTDILKYTSVKQKSFGEGIRSKDRVIQMTNHNHLLGAVDGVDGFKTGYTKGAGFCLSTTAMRNGRRIIVVTMGSADRKVRDKKIAELIERGFANLPPLPPKPVIVKTAATEPATLKVIEEKAVTTR